MSTYRAVLWRQINLSSSLSQVTTSKPLAVWGVCTYGDLRFKTPLPEPAKLLFFSVFQFCYPVHRNSISREVKRREQRLLNAVVRFAFNLRLIARESPFKKDANMLLIENVCKMVTFCLVHKFLTLEERATVPQWDSPSFQQTDPSSWLEASLSQSKAWGGTMRLILRWPDAV